MKSDFLQHYVLCGFSEGFAGEGTSTILDDALLFSLLGWSSCFSCHLLCKTSQTRFTAI